MTNEEAKSELMQIYGMLSEEKKQALDVLMAQADGGYISRQAVLDITWEEPSYTDALNVLTEVRDKIKALPSVKQEPQLEQFAKWVASEIFDDMWEYNKDAFAELACRKLSKLGIVRAKGDEWELVDPPESEE